MIYDWQKGEIEFQTLVASVTHSTNNNIGTTVFILIANFRNIDNKFIPYFIHFNNKEFISHDRDIVNILMPSMTSYL